MTSSMHHDLERGNRPEVRWLAGAVVELRGGHGTPLNRAVADIRALRERRRRAGMIAAPALTVCSPHSCRRQPMRFALGTSAATVREPAVARTSFEEGITGRATCSATARAGPPPSRCCTTPSHDRRQRVAPLHNAAKLERRFALIGVTGVVRMVLSALDMALWDALAVAAGQPLATLLGGSPRPIPGLQFLRPGLMAPEAAADEAERLLAGGFKAVKLRLGHATLAEDLAVTRAVRRRLADDIAVMVDYNQALTVAQALERGRALAHEGVYWIEEPIRHDDLAGYATLVGELALPIQIGENFDGPKAMAQALDAGACDFVMPDAGRIGGVTGGNRPRASPLRAASKCPLIDAGVSAHLLAATPTAHWLDRRLGRCHPRGAARNHRRAPHCTSKARHRPRLERRGGDALPARLTTNGRPT
jgi:mandelate racemase